MAHDPHNHHQQAHHHRRDSYHGYHLDFMSANQQTFDATTNSARELYNLQAGMEMLGLPTKHHYHDQVQVQQMMIAPDPSSSAAAPPPPIIRHAGSLSLSLYQNLDLSPTDSANLVSAQQRHHSATGFFPSSPWQLKSSKYLASAQELLKEFCSTSTQRHRNVNLSAQHHHAEPCSDSPVLASMNPHDLQKLKAKLYFMLEELDKRYRRYREQMKLLGSSFEAVAGERSAEVYLTVVLRGISERFGSVRDNIVKQISATRSTLGERNNSVGISGRGETPMLKFLDQRIRQQKQAGMMESHPWRPQRGLPERSVSILRAWLFEHFLHPYPTDVDKIILSRQTGLSKSQVSNWFINARVRLWKPMIEEMYLEEMKEEGHDHATTTSSFHEMDRQLSMDVHNNPNSYSSDVEEKPFPSQLLPDTGSLASIISGGHRKEASMVDSNHFGMTDHMVNFNSGSRVSLTLGLQQHNGRTGFNNISFGSPSSNNSSSLLFTSSEQRQIPDQVQPSDDLNLHHHPHHYSMVEEVTEGDESFQYRNLMGSQLLHDLAG